MNCVIIQQHTHISSLNNREEIDWYYTFYKIYVWNMKYFINIYINVQFICMHIYNKCIDNETTWNHDMQLLLILIKIDSKKKIYLQLPTNWLSGFGGTELRNLINMVNCKFQSKSWIFIVINVIAELFHKYSILNRKIYRTKN